MGFLSLLHWVDSDNAAGFRHLLQEQFKKFAKDPAALKRAVRGVVSNELKDMANDYNTPGFVNLALVMETEGDAGDMEYEDPGLPVFSNLLTMAQLEKASKLFVQEQKNWSYELRSRMKELHKVIVKALKARKKTNR